jgi:hypothetical protein
LCTTGAATGVSLVTEYGSVSSREDGRQIRGVISRVTSIGWVSPSGIFKGGGSGRRVPGESTGRAPHSVHGVKRPASDAPQCSHWG